METNNTRETVTDDGPVEPTRARQKTPEYWVSLLEVFLPKNLSFSFRQENHIAFQDEVKFDKVHQILQDGWSSTGVDILAFMVLDQYRYKAVLYLADILLKSFPEFAVDPDEGELPSNIAWPVESLSSSLVDPIELDLRSDVNRWRRGGVVPALQEDRVGEGRRRKVLQSVWPCLAELVTGSARRQIGEAQQIMSTVHQITARIHHLGMVPSTVYTYSLPQAPTTVQHPPIINLLTSRILSTLSDAVWRAYQEDAIARALESGLSYYEFSPDIPGGRDRIKVRELGPEVWVEFFLWCCIEGGFATAGSRILSALRKDVEHRWYALHWTPGQGLDNELPVINWDRVRRRYGGTAGKIEGYSFATPFAEMPTRTISAEVVLALVECLINSADVDAMSGGLPVDQVRTEVCEAVSFLEPHGLRPEYFDYLAVRLIQTESFHTQPKADALRDWAFDVSHLRDLRPIKAQRPRRPGLNYDYIVQHSELQAGILHQALQAYVESSLVTKAVDTFTDVQKLVDGSKLEAIGEFVSLTVQPEDGFFTSRPGKRHTEYISSHGQLPMYKMPLILDMITNAKLFGLGDWLLHSEDIDGPVLPFSAYHQPSIGAALCRYAVARNEPLLIKSILMGCKSSGRKPTVTLLRALVCSRIRFRAWSDAVFLLGELKAANGGGYSPGIVANLAATVLHLEAELKSQKDVKSISDLRQAQSLLNETLQGRYDASKSNFRVAQKKEFKQQVGFLLQILETMSDSSVQNIALRWKPLFPVGNQPILARDTFHVLFAAIVDSNGALEGRRIWDMFCKEPESSIAIDSLFLRGLSEETSGLPSPTTELIQTSPNKLVPAEGDVLRDDSIALPSATFDEPFFKYHTSSNAERWPLSFSSGGETTNEVPFDMVRKEHEDEQGFFGNPVVIPDIHTLQILVRGALTEARSGNQFSHEKKLELKELLVWATKIAKTLGLSQTDVEAELQISSVLSAELISTAGYRISYRERKRQRSFREHPTLDLGHLFGSGVFSRQRSLPPRKRGR